MRKQWKQVTALACVMAFITLMQMGCPPGTATVPDLSGLTVAQATTALNDVGLVLGSQTIEFHPSIDEDLVIESSPASSSEVDAGSTVDVTVSNGNAIRVDQNVVVKGDSDGLSWETAYTTLQPAIDFVWSNGGGEVWVSKGTYDDVRDSNSTGSLKMRTNVDIYGGFDASDKGAADTFAGRDWNTHVTTIDGANGRGAGLAAWHTVMGSNNGRLDGFVVTGGNSAGAAAGVDSYGAGIFNSGDDPTIANCTITGNVAGRGAAIYNLNSSNPTIENCNITLNTSSAFGGAIYAAINCAFTMANCYVAGNTATTDDGGAIANAGAVGTTIVNTVFFNNMAGDIGGAIANYSNGTIDLTNCTLAYNTADNAGGLATTLATSTLTNTIVHSNTGTTVNDNLYTLTGTLTANYSLFDGVVAGTSNVNDNPDFNDGPNGDLTLDSGEPSPAIDAGTGDTGTYPNVPSDDLPGNPRPSGSSHDIGAYEYQVP